MVSWYYFCIERYEEFKDDTFDTFIIKRINRDDMLPSMIYLLCDDNGTIMVDYVGRFENLMEHWYEITQKICGTNIELIKTNVSQNRIPWQDCITHQSKKLIYDFYKEDFERWYSDVVT
jgi:hypothetical protein